MGVEGIREAGGGWGKQTYLELTGIVIATKHKKNVCVCFPAQLANIYTFTTRKQERLRFI